jgi:uroporphyrinogen-III synthase
MRPVNREGPLQGRTVVVTRAAAQATALTTRLEALGARVVEVPTIVIDPPASWAALDGALDALDRFTWVIFTSVNAVLMLERRLTARGASLHVLADKRLGAVGATTAAALVERDLVVHALPDTYRAEALVERLRFAVGPRDHVLLPAATETRDVLSEGLRHLGATVTEVPVYATRPVARREDGLFGELAGGAVDVITFTSPSTVRAFAELFTDDERQIWAGRVRVATIGPVTAAKAREYGLETTVMPAVQTVEALAQAIADHFSAGAPGSRTRSE